MTPGRRSSERGVALILVLVVLPLVAIIMTQLNFETTIGSRLASNALANQQFKLAIRARLEQMRRRLVRDLKDDEQRATEGGAYDHYGDLWGPETEGGMSNLQVAKGDAEAGDDVTLYTQVFDEQGKFNINLLTHKDAQRARRAMDVFKNLLDFYRDDRFGDFESNDFDLNPVEAKEVAEAVLKFLKGEGRDERVQQAQGIPDPSPDMKQGVYAVDDLVFSHRLFLEKRMMQRIKDLNSGQVLPGLGEFLTVYGDGKINANTAPIQVLRALFKEEEGWQLVAENILHGRGGYLNTDEEQDQRREDLEERQLDEQESGARDDEPVDDTGYRNVNDIGDVEGMKNSAFLSRNEIDIGRDFAVQSNYFLVVVTARRENFLRQHRVVYERHARGCVTHSSEVRTADIDDLPADLDLIQSDEEPAER